MPFQKTRIGEVAYVWSASGGKDSDSCVISAHGGYGGFTFITRKKAIGSSKKGIIPMLHFYCEHGYKLMMPPSIANMVSGKYRVVESVSATNMTQDYELTKFVSASVTGPYDYADVKTVPEVMNKASMSHLKQMNEYGARMGNVLQVAQGFNGGAAIQDGFDQMIMESFTDRFEAAKEKWKFHSNIKNAYDNKMDIVTIRNRPFHANATLSEVIAALYAAGFDYKHIHCFFCRGSVRSKYVPEKKVELNPGRTSEGLGNESF